jgi:hypothetical protein
LFGLRADAYPVTNLLDAHILEMRLIHLHEIFAIDMIFLEELNVLRAIDSLEPIAYLLLIPVSH